MVTSIQVGVETLNTRPLYEIWEWYLTSIAVDKHISTICKTSQHHLQNTGNIRKFLDHGSAETLVHSFVTSKIDCCNAFVWTT